MKRWITYVAFVMVLGGLAQAQCNAKIEAFTKQSGYTFKSDPKCRFWVTFEALSIPRDGMQGSILIGEQDDVIVLGAVVKLKANLNLSSATLAKLLHLNHELDFVKVGIDNDGDLFLRAELHKASLDVASLKDAFERVQEGSQKVYDATR